jgi:hypothetical protein
MKSAITAGILALTVSTALAAAPPKAASKHSGGMSMACCKKCPMCQAKMAGGKGKAGVGHGGHATAGKPGMGKMPGKPGMGGMMGGKGAPPAPTGGSVAITVTPEGYAYVVRGDVLYKFDADLNLTAQARLGSPPPPKPPTGHEDPRSHPKP